MKNAGLLVAGHKVWLKCLNVLERCASCTVRVHIRPPNLKRRVPEDAVLHVYVQYCENKKICSLKLYNTSYFTKYGIKYCHN